MRRSHADDLSTCEHCTTTHLNAWRPWAEARRDRHMFVFWLVACFCPTHGQHFDTQKGCELGSIHRAYVASVCFENLERRYKTPYEFLDLRIGEMSAGYERRLRCTESKTWQRATDPQCCVASSCVDRDRLLFCLRAFSMVGHFLNQAVAGIVKPIDICLAFLSQNEAAAYGDPLARAWTSIWDQPHLRALLWCSMLLAKMRESEKLENTFTGPPPLLPSMASMRTRICGSRPRTRLSPSPRPWLLTASHALSCALRLTLRGCWDSGSTG